MANPHGIPPGLFLKPLGPPGRPPTQAEIDDYNAKVLAAALAFDVPVRKTIVNYLQSFLTLPGTSDQFKNDVQAAINIIKGG